jgi:hypothetical protein
LRAGNGDHPGYAELVDAHAEEGRPEGGAEGHLDGASGFEFVEEALDFVRAVVGDGDLEAAEGRLAALGASQPMSVTPPNGMAVCMTRPSDPGGTGAPSGASPKVMQNWTLLLKVRS